MQLLGQAPDLLGSFFTTADALVVRRGGGGGAAEERRARCSRPRRTRSRRSRAEWGVDAVQVALEGALIDGLGLKPRVAFGPVRVATSGRRVSPPLFESLAILGRGGVARPRSARCAARSRPVSAERRRPRRPGRRWAVLAAVAVVAAVLVVVIARLIRVLAGGARRSSARWSGAAPQPDGHPGRLPGVGGLDPRAERGVPALHRPLGLAHPSRGAPVHLLDATERRADPHARTRRSGSRSTCGRTTSPTRSGC